MPTAVLVGTMPATVRVLFILFFTLFLHLFFTLFTFLVQLYSVAGKVCVGANGGDCIVAAALGLGGFSKLMS